MPKMPKSVQWSSEPDVSTPPMVRQSAGLTAGDSLPGTQNRLGQFHVFAPVFCLSLFRWLILYSFSGGE
jgi:hypothetical protein